MACSTRPGPQALIHFVEGHCDVKISQNDWHSLRTLAEKEDADAAKSRRVATKREIEAAVNSLAAVVADENGANIDIHGERHYIDDWTRWDGTTGAGPNPWSPREGQFDSEDFAMEARSLVKTLESAKVTVGSLEAIGYLSAYGVQEGLQDVKVENLRRKTRESARKMSDEDLKKALDKEFTDWAERSGPLGVAGDERTERQARISVLEEVADERGLIHREPGLHYGKWVDDPSIKPETVRDLDKEAALAALDKKVNRERKKQGLPPVESYEDDNKAEADLADYDREFDKRMSAFQARGLSEYDAARAAETELSWEKRVAALESEGIPTSDAQAMVDAEDVQANRETLASILRKGIKA